MITVKGFVSWSRRAAAACTGVLATMLLAAGCAHRSSTLAIDQAMILPAGAQTLEVPADQAFLMAGPVSNPPPAFPDGLVDAASSPVAVCAEFVVEADGAVRTVTPLFELPECPLPASRIDPRYVAAVEAAVRQWQFFAAATCTFPPGVAKDDTCDGEGVEVTPVAIKLAYVFTFRVEQGRGQVVGTPSQRETRP
jgi:hypothetical protein